MKLSLTHFDGLEDLYRIHIISKQDFQNLDPAQCFWIGSVSMKDPKRVEKFLESIKTLALEQLSNFQDISSNGIYAIIVTDKRGDRNQQLIVIRSENTQQTCLYKIPLPAIEIASKPSLSLNINGINKIKWSDIFKSLFR